MDDPDTSVNTKLPLEWAEPHSYRISHYKVLVDIRVVYLKVEL